MIQRNIRNSSNKIIGECVITDHDISLIYSKASHNLTITDPLIVEWAQVGGYNAEAIMRAWNIFYVKISEIAAMGNVLYHRANKWIKHDLQIVPKKEGRRNASYGEPFSEERKAKIADSKARLKASGWHPTPYERTPEIRAKIAAGVKKAQEEGRAPSPRDVAIKGWKNGKFKGVDFKRGIGGTYYSIKNHQTMRFRSLLELKYAILLENDENLSQYQYESLTIELGDGTSYTPDFQIGSRIIELKSRRFIEKSNAKYQERFAYKCAQATAYCAANGLQFEVIYDDEIGFDTERFKHELNDQKYCETYHIHFFQPDRVWSTK